MIAGRQCCACHSKDLLKLLSDLLEHESEEVRSYTHGTLYSILGVVEIRMEARAMVSVVISCCLLLIVYCCLLLFVALLNFYVFV